VIGCKSVAMRRFSGRFLLSLLTLICTFVAAPLQADALDGEFDVRSAFINIANGVYLLHADVRYPGNDAMRTALADGVTLDFDLQVTVFRARRYWFDADLVDLTLRRQLSYQGVSSRFIVKETGRDEQTSYATLEAALADLGKIEDWPILTQPQLTGDGNYRVAVRASMRRGKLNDALRAILFWTNNWQRTSEWYEWSLLR
jgi:Domain of unknown function (DUF4390)